MLPVPLGLWRYRPSAGYVGKNAHASPPRASRKLHAVRAQTVRKFDQTVQVYMMVLPRMKTPTLSSLVHSCGLIDATSNEGVEVSNDRTSCTTVTGRAKVAKPDTHCRLASG